jgi:alpha-glucosidase (family GH31 glycosyl hydrolase)
MVSDNYQYFEAYAYYSDKAAKEGVIATFGQRSGDLFVKDGVYGMWTKDEAIKYSFNAAEQNMQSVHPFFMAQISDGSWYGVYSNVAAAQEWELVNESKNNRVKIKVNALGGAGDFYFMFGKDPNEVITKYHNLIGKASKAAQWSLGWHIFLPQNCSTGKCATDLVSD